MNINYIEMINHDLQKLSEENLYKAWSYVHALSTLQRNEEEIKSIEYDLGVQRHVHVGKNDKLISAQASADNLSFFINDNLLSAQRHVCVGTL